MSVAAWLVTMTIATGLSTTPAIPAEGDGCGTAAGLDEVAVICETTETGLAETIATAPTGTVYKTQIRCTDTVGVGTCYNTTLCAAPPGALRYDVLKSVDGGQTFTKISEACLTQPPPPRPGITLEMVTTQFRAIAWGESPLILQPTGGRTLVNLPTNLYTDNTAPRTQTVTLLGQQVDIEATPTTWTWHHGDGTTQTTNTPGTAYPDLTITHTYLDAARHLTPSLDTTYTGRYRIDDGAWTDIPDTVTVPGTPTQLDVVTAKPQLVAPE